jgi:putative component of membrane protein insertase Oxa1/YidC/SpoIIIJ protein YidD
MKCLVIVLLFFSLVNVMPLIAEETAYDVLVTEPYNEESGIEKAIRFYQENISQHDGARCLYYPTCSAFYREAVKQYGFVWGNLMVVDRMVYREDPASMVYYDLIEERGSYFDPVYQNYIFEPSDYYK